MGIARRPATVFFLAFGILAAVGLVVMLRPRLGRQVDRLARVAPGVVTLAGRGQDAVSVSGADTGSNLNPFSTRGSLSLAPGAYRLRLNASAWHVDVEPGRTSSVPVGAVVVEGVGEDHYQVLDRSGGDAETSSPTGKAMELFPGKYGVCLNGVWQDVMVERGAPAIIRTGVLLLRGQTGMVYRVFDSVDGRPLAVREVGRPVEMFPGTYRLSCGGWSAVATVRPGTKWAVQPAPRPSGSVSNASADRL